MNLRVYEIRQQQKPMKDVTPIDEKTSLNRNLWLSHIIGLAFWCLHSLISIDLHVCGSPADRWQITHSHIYKFILFNMKFCHKSIDHNGMVSIRYAQHLFKFFPSFQLALPSWFRRSGKVEKHISLYFRLFRIIIIIAHCCRSFNAHQYIGLVSLTQKDVWP